MNEIIKEGIIFIAGLIVGVVFQYLRTKRKFNCLLDERLDEEKKEGLKQIFEANLNKHCGENVTNP